MAWKSEAVELASELEDTIDSVWHADTMPATVKECNEFVQAVLEADADPATVLGVLTNQETIESLRSQDSDIALEAEEEKSWDMVILVLGAFKTVIDNLVHA